MSTIYLDNPACGCAEGVKLLAIFGAIVLFLLLYGFVAWIVSIIYLEVKGKKWNQLSREQKDNLLAIAWLWPLTLVVLGVYWLVKWVALPFTAAEKSDLRKMEARIDKKIVLNGVPTPKSKFQVGDLIIGIKGNPGRYQHLNEGSVSKVLSIDEKGSMKVILLDHKDFEDHKEQIGKTYTAPARNFVKYTKKR